MLHPSCGRVAAMVVVCLMSGSAGCGMSAVMASKAVAPSASPAPAAAPLERSLFARDPNGQLSEDALQKILAAPIKLDLPSRVGVLPIHTATD